ncbi:MAG: hypothetical protein MR412_03320 [Firmicutes bacterium]|nr:hypothetical protein [Bacillota bacterium]
MSAFGKSALFNDENIASETVTETPQNQSVIDEQVGKFDNSYSANEKLQELYNEFDKITLDENKIKEFTQVKVNAVSNKVPFRVALTMVTVVIVTLLLAFLCIYNIFVINGMSNNISYLQEEVATAEYDLTVSEGLYERLTSTENIKKELSDMGYSQMPSSNTVAVSVPDKVEVTELQGQTNWFDTICNFFSRIFG